MSDEDEEGAQKLAVLIGAMLVFATVCVGFSVSIFLLLNVGYLYGWLSDTSTLCYRICREDWRRKRKPRVAPIEVEAIRIQNIINQTSRSADSTNQQNDQQLVFGSLNILTRNSLEVNENTVRHNPSAELQNEYERRALEGRANLDNKDSTLPPYSSKDESLPSYDQALKNQVDDS